MKSRVFITISVLFAALSVSCGAGKSTIVNDFFLAEGGMVVHGKTLHAFVFENKHNDFHFRQYMKQRFALTSEDMDFNESLNGQAFTFYVYSKADFEKYFISYNFKYSGLVNDISSDLAAADHFIAISVTDSFGNDALSEDHIQHNEILGYLEKFKSDYLR